MTGNQAKEAHADFFESALKELFHIDALALYVLRMHDGKCAPAWISHNFAELTGYSVEEILHAPDWWIEHVHPRDRKRLLSNQRALLRQDMAFIEEYRFRRKDGSYFGVCEQMKALRDGAGKVREVVGAWMEASQWYAALEKIKSRDLTFRMMFIDNPLPMYIFALDDLRFLEVNAAALEQYGYSRDEFLALRATDIRPKGEIARFLETLRFSFLHDKKRHFEDDWHHLLRDGRAIDVALTAHVLDFYGRRAMLVSARDITAHRRAEEALRRSEANLARAQAITHLGSWEWDIAADVLCWSDEVYRIFGVDPDRFGATCGAFLDFVHPDDRALVERTAQAAVNERRPYSLDHRILLPDGAVKYVHEQAEVFHDGQGQAVKMVGTVQDITERKLIEEQLGFLAHHDALTRLPNRVLLQDRLSHAIARAHRAQRHVAVLFLDLDEFKRVNDTLGHDAGDELLRAVAGRLQGRIREGDTLARLGGDEFVVLLEDLKGTDEIAVCAEALLQNLACTPFVVSGQEFFMTASIGISVYPDNGGDSGTLFKNADTAMYHSKQTGKDKIHFYAEEMNARTLEKIRMSSRLHRALEREEFCLFYQPKLDLGTGRVVGLEALLRWNDPEQGLVSPADFIPVLEDSGLIIPVGEWVLRSTCRQIQAWRQEGLPPIKVAVNVSAKQFKRDNLAETVRRILEESGLEAQYLELELTESLLMENAEAAIGVLHALKGMGVGLAVDDFGTGYSSLSYLKRFPIDALKIDQSFIRDIIQDPDDAAITKAIIDMSQSLDLRVIAEGVETAEQVGFLQRHRCHEVQGYYFSRPMPADQVPAFLHSYSRRPITAFNACGCRSMLIVDDDKLGLAFLQALFESNAYRVFTADTIQGAFETLAVNDIHVLITDQSMPGMMGTEFLKHVKVLYPGIVRVMLSGYNDLQVVTEAINKGLAFKFLLKHADSDTLLKEIEEAFSYCSELRERGS